VSAGNLALIYRLGDFPSRIRYTRFHRGLESALGNAYPHLGVFAGRVRAAITQDGGKAEAKGLERRAKAVLANANLARGPVHYRRPDTDEVTVGAAT
jgi:hypothetical protein